MQPCHALKGALAQATAKELRDGWRKVQQDMHNELGNKGSVLVWVLENMLDYDMTNTLVFW